MGIIHLYFNSESLDSLEDFKSFMLDGDKVSIYRKDIADYVRRGTIISWLRQQGATEWAQMLSDTERAALSDTDAVKLLLELVGGNTDKAVLDWKRYLQREDCIVSYDNSKIYFVFNYEIVEKTNDSVPVILLINESTRICAGEISLRTITKGRIEFEKGISETVFFSIRVFVGGEPISFFNKIPLVFEGTGIKKAYKDISKLLYFSQGYALIQLQSTQEWHFVSTDGTISSDGYEDARHFTQDGFAAVKRNGLWGFINKRFTCGTGYIYKRLGDFSEGLAYYEKDTPEKYVKVERGFLNTSFDRALDLTWNYKGYGLLFDNCFKEGLFKIWSDCHAEWIDHDGKIISKIENMRERISNFSSLHVGDVINGAVEVTYSHWVTPDDCFRRSSRFIVRENRHINALGNLSEEGFSYSHKTLSSRQETDYNGTLFMVNDVSDYGYINRDGDFLTDTIYKRARSFSEHFAAVSLDNYHWGFINTEFKPICEFVFSDTGHFSEGMAAVEQNGKWGFIDTSGILVIRCEYNKVRHFAEGLAPVELNNKWGAIDKEGKLIIPCAFEEISQFSEGYCGVLFDGKRFILDKEGNPLLLKDEENEVEKKEHHVSDTPIASYKRYERDEWDEKLNDALNYANNGWYTPGAPDMP